MKVQLLEDISLAISCGPTYRKVKVITETNLNCKLEQENSLSIITNAKIISIKINEEKVQSLSFENRHEAIFY
jgi:hypothetical protein